MAPPPATPTPKRFIIPRKNHSGTGTIINTGVPGSSQRQPQQQQQQQQQHETPEPSLPPPSYHHAAVHQGGGGGSSQQQFRATPRFSLHSTPRLSQQHQYQRQTQQLPPSTPAGPPGGHYFRSSRAKNAGPPGTAPFDDDLIDSSPPPPPSPPTGDDAIVYDVEEHEGSDEAGAVLTHGRAAGYGEQIARGLARGRTSRGAFKDEDVLDSIVTESSPPTGEELEYDGLSKHARHADVESEDDLGSVAPMEQETFDERSTKRRRLSVSSVPASDDEDEEGVDLPSLPSDAIGEIVQDDSGHVVEVEEAERLRDGDGPLEEDEMEIEPDGNHTESDALQVQGLQPSIEEATTDTRSNTATAPISRQQQQQPVFHRAPRFKPKETEHNGINPSHGSDHQHERHYDPLPEAFSPSRRGPKGGSKYLPGGLASELRDWLVEMEAATGTKREGEWLARVVVDELATSLTGGRVGVGVGGMYLVHGHHIAETDIDEPSGQADHAQGAEDCGNHDTMDHDGNDLPRSQGVLKEPDSGLRHTESSRADYDNQQDLRVKIILAGEGRTTPGIAKRKPVQPGVIVGIARPTWEITLGDDLGRWAVACDWALLD